MTASLSEATRHALSFVCSQNLRSKDCLVKSSSEGVYFMFTDACFVNDYKTGWLRGVLMDASGMALSWFGEELDEEFCPSVMVDG